MKLQLEKADTILKYLAAFINKDISEDQIVDITNAVAEYADQYWPDGPKVERI